MNNITRHFPARDPYHTPELSGWPQKVKHLSHSTVNPNRLKFTCVSSLADFSGSAHMSRVNLCIRMCRIGVEFPVNDTSLPKIAILV